MPDSCNNARSSGPREAFPIKIYEAFKNVPIQESKDMPKSFQQYYKNDENEEYIDISNHCYLVKSEQRNCR